MPVVHERVKFYNRDIRRVRSNDIYWYPVVFEVVNTGILSQLPSVTAMTEALWNESPDWGVDLSSTTSSVERVPLAVIEMMKIAVDYLWQTQNLEFDEQIFTETFSRHSYHWFSTTRTSELTIPLFGLEASEMSVTLDSDTLLQPFPDTDKERLWGMEEEDLGWVVPNQFAYSTHCVKTTVVHARYNEGPQAGFDRARSLVTALRLLKRGDVYSVAVISETRPATIDRPRYVLNLEELRAPTHSMGAYYTLDHADIAGIQKLYAAAHTVITKNAPLSVGLRRFNLSVGRDQEEDKLIDLVVTLESMLLHRTKRKCGEASQAHRLALRGANTWTVNSDATKAYEMLRAAYRIRNKLVHQGAKINVLDGDPVLYGLSGAIVIRELPDTVRHILRQYLNEVSVGKSLEQVNHTFDAQLLTRLGSKILQEIAPREDPPVKF